MTAVTVDPGRRTPILDPTALFEQVQRTVDEARRILSLLGERVQESYNTPSYVAGVCATYAVRAGADPVWASEEQLSWMVASLLNPGPATWDEVGLMDREHRIEVAVAALRSYVLHRPDPGYACTFGGVACHDRVTVNTFTVRSAA